MVDSGPRWQLSLSGPIESDRVDRRSDDIAFEADTPFGTGTFSWQDTKGSLFTFSNAQTEKKSD